MAGEGQSDKMMSDVEARMNQRVVTEFLDSEKITPTDIHQLFLNISRNQIVDMRTARCWVVHFSSGDSNNGSPPLVQVVTSIACRLCSLLAEMHS